MDVSEAHELFKDWARKLEVEGDPVPVTHSLPVASEARGLSVVFRSAVPDPERRARVRVKTEQRQEPIARLRYIAVLNGADHAQMEVSLVRLLSIAMHQPGVQVLSETVPERWWQAYEVHPRPAFQFEILITETVRHDVSPLVQEHELQLEAVGNRVSSKNQSK